MEMSAPPGTPLLTALEQLAPHDHLCSIYESPEEHFAVAMPFIRIGLDRGEKCIYIADDGTEAVVRDAMYAEGIDVERAIATDSLVLETKEAAYLKHGSFDPEWMFTFWADATAEAMRQGFSALRATGETEWVLRGAHGTRAVDGVREPADAHAGGPQLFRLVSVQPPALSARARPGRHPHASDGHLSRRRLPEHVLRARRMNSSAPTRPRGRSNACSRISANAR